MGVTAADVLLHRVPASVCLPNQGFGRFFVLELVHRQTFGTALLAGYQLGVAWLRPLI